jgi:hypothetical protein
MHAKIPGIRNRGYTNEVHLCPGDTLRERGLIFSLGRQALSV